MPAQLVALWDIFLPFGLVLSLTTQLRPEGAPVGPGELMLALWLVPRTITALWQYRVSATPRVLVDLLGFWAAFTVSLCLGFIVSIVQGQFVDWSLSLHDVLSYALLFTLGATLTVACGSPQHLQRLLRYTCLVGNAAIILQVLQGLYGPAIGTMDLWYWDRFRGWCENPNQFALVCLALAFLSIAASERETSRLFRILIAGGAILSLATGFMAKSNAYNGIALASVLLFVLVKIIRAAPVFALLRSATFWASVSAVAAMVLGAILFAPMHRTDTNSTKPFFARDNDMTDKDAPLRIAIWTEALRTGSGAWYLGLGPGPHLKIPTSVLVDRRGGSEPRNLYHPKLRIAPNFEAHNTILELFVQGGLLAAVSFVALCGTAFWRALRGGADGFAIALVALFGFGSFHVIFRHPIVWFLIVNALSIPRFMAPQYAKVPFRNSDWRAGFGVARRAAS